MQFKNCNKDAISSMFVIARKGLISLFIYALHILFEINIMKRHYYLICYKILPYLQRYR